MSTLAEDLERDVLCVLGLPIDRISLQSAVERIRKAAAKGKPFLLSTPNLNFLIQSRADPEFRDSIIASDLSVADGAPLVILARWIGRPLPGRVAGSDLIDAMQKDRCAPRVKIFLFGGAEDVAQRACARLRDVQGGLACAGACNPGFGTNEVLSRPEVIEEINKSRADFLLVALGATKGQRWLMHNHDRITVPVRSHLGATINFLAGTVKRAPSFMRSLGLEWLWRIKEEPLLAHRYARDGLALLTLLVTEVLPLVLQRAWLKLARERETPLVIMREITDAGVTLRVSGSLGEEGANRLRSHLRHESRENPITLDVGGIDRVDTTGAGLLLLLQKHCRGERLRLLGAGSLRFMLRRHGIGFTLE